MGKNAGRSYSLLAEKWCKINVQDWPYYTEPRSRDPNFWKRFKIVCSCSEAGALLFIYFILDRSLESISNFKNICQAVITVRDQKTQNYTGHSSAL